MLYVFKGDAFSGLTSYGGLVRDAAGNLYGTTEYGGTGTGYGCNARGCGLIFEITP